MVVSVGDLGVELRIVGDGADLSDAQMVVLARLRRVGDAHVALLIPTAPAAIQDECVIRLASYIYDQPLGRRDAYANAWVNSGAGALAARWRVQRVSGAAVSTEIVDPGEPLRLLGWSVDEIIDADDLAAAGAESFENAVPIPQFDADNAYLWAATWLDDLPTSVGSSAGPLPRRDDVTFDGREWAVFRSDQFIQTRLADFGLDISFRYNGIL